MAESLVKNTAPINPLTGEPFTEAELAELNNMSMNSARVSTTTMDPAYASAYEQTLADYDAAVAGQKQTGELNLQSLKDKLEKAQSYQYGADVRPLAALLDQWQAQRGVQSSNVEQAAALAQKEAGRKKEVSDTEALLREYSAGMSQAEINALKEKMRSLGMMQVTTTKAAASRASADQKSKELKDRFDQNKLMQLAKEFKEVPGIVTKIGRIIKIIPDSGPIPGVGVGESAFKDFLLSDKGSAIRQDASSIAAAMLKIQSGTAASEAEVTRLMETYGISPTSKESTFRRGIKNLTEEFISTVNGTEAGFEPNIVARRKSLGGMTAEDVVSKLKPKSSNTVTVTNGTETLEIPRANLKDAIADGYKEVK